MVEQARGIRSFVLRQGRLTHGQERALSELWPVYGLEIADGNPLQVFERQAAVTLEIGFGMGESLAEQAEQYPERNYIGIEVHAPGVGHLLMRANESALTNLRIYRDDSIDVLNRVIPDHSLAVIQVFFPDPWPKKRHHKRRLVNATFAELCRSKLVQGGLLHMATDWLPYAEEVKLLMQSITGYQEVMPPVRPETKFERRGRRLEHTITDMAWASVGQQ